MAEDFKTFMRFTEPEMAQEIAAILEAEHILHNIHDSRKDFDPSFNNSDVGKDISIQIRPQDFPKAEKIINEKLELHEEQIDPNHFLFGFSVDELKDVVKHADEWHPLDVKLAMHLLSEKGLSMSDEEISDIQKIRLEEKSKPEKIGTEWIAAGYFFAVFGGFLGLFIGYYIMHFKKTLPDGNQVYNYDASDRKNGRYMFILSIIALCVGSAYYFLRAKN